MRGEQHTHSYANCTLASKSNRSGLDSLACTVRQGNLELSKCIQRGLLKGPELETSLECESELEGARKASGAAINVRMEAS